MATRLSWRMVGSDHVLDLERADLPWERSRQSAMFAPSIVLRLEELPLASWASQRRTAWICYIEPLGLSLRLGAPPHDADEARRQAAIATEHALWTWMAQASLMSDAAGPGEKGPVS